MDKQYIERETVEKEIKRKLFGNCSFCAASERCFSRKGTHRNCWTMPKFPVSDAVEVVRCKDCQFRKKDEIGRGFCELTDTYCGDSDYCSRGMSGESEEK